MLVLANNTQTIAKMYCEILFHESNLEWKNIYVLPRIVTIYNVLMML